MAGAGNRKDADPVTQPVVTLDADGRRIVLRPLEATHTDCDDVEGFARGIPPQPAEQPKPRFQIKGIIRID